VVVSSEVFHARLPDLIACSISSQPRFYRRPGPGDCPLRDWRAIGLRHPSTVQISKILAVDKAIIKQSLGLVSAQDLVRVEAGVRQALGLA
jgi:mRNA-degrading endonuclease toxin of MazEF toxin-antitoxin module